MALTNENDENRTMAVDEWIEVASLSTKFSSSTEAFAAAKRAVVGYLTDQDIRSDVLRVGDIRTEGPDERGVMRVLIRQRAIRRARRWRGVGRDSPDVVALKGLTGKIKLAIAAGLVGFVILAVYIGDRTSDLVVLGLAFLVGAPLLRVAIRSMSKRR